MSLRKRVWRLLGKFDRRVTLVEDAAERVEGAVLNILDIATEMRATVTRLETAVVEQGRTLHDMLNRLHEEAVIRSGIGREQMRQSVELGNHDDRLGALESAANGK